LTVKNILLRNAGKTLIVYAAVLGVKVFTRLHREHEKTEPVCQAAGMN
jgi:hypothetical protein